MAATVVPATSGRCRPSSRDLWKQALLELQAKNKLSFDVGRTDRRVVVEEVLAEVLKKEELSQAKRWKWKNQKGETVIVRDVFAKIVKWVNKFKEIGDTVIQYDPGHAALPWAAIRLVLQVAGSDDQVLGSIAEGLDLVLMLMARYEIVEHLLLQGSSEAQVQLSEGILKLYIAILYYLSEIYRYHTQSTPGKLASSVLRAAENASQKCINKIKNAESEVHFYSQLVSYETTRSTSYDVHSIRANVQQIAPVSERVIDLQTAVQDMKAQLPELTQELERLQNILSDLGKPMPRVASALSTIKDNLDKSERLKIFNWLTSIRYTRHQKEKVKNLLKGSGQWLFKKPEFVDWMTASTSSILWLHGIPGSGKSMLVAAVIEYLRRRDEEVEIPAPIGFFYCARNMNEPERADPEVILRTILEQLSSTNKHYPIRKPVCKKYILAEDESRGRPPDKLTLEETVDIILELLRDNPATIILDGLDECDPRKRQSLLNGLQKIIKESDNIVKIFVSSRDDHDLVHRLAETPNLYIHAADNDNDIKSFILSRVSNAITDGRLLCGRVSDKLKKLILDTLIKKAKGMFRLVSLHIETLCDPQQIKTEENVLIALKRLPKDLSESYSVILKQVNNSEEPNPKIAEITMRWLLCATRILPSQVLIRAVCLGLGMNIALNRADILSVCMNLVIYDAESDVFRFAHLSVQEYLQSLKEYKPLDNIDALTAEQCISYLLEHPMSDKALTKTIPATNEDGLGPLSMDYFKTNDKPDLIFMDYCIENWIVHVQMVPEKRKHGSLQKKIRQILFSKVVSPIRHRIVNIGITSRFGEILRHTALPIQFEAWITCHQPPQGTAPGLLPGKSPSRNIMFMACIFGLSEIVEEVLSNLDSVAFILQTRNLEGLTCAQSAALFNQGHIIPILFRASQIARLPDKYWHEVLHTTCTLKMTKCTFMRPREQFQVLEQMVECCTHGFLTEEELTMIMRKFYYYFNKPDFKSLFSRLLSHCGWTQVLNVIMSIGGKYGQDWFKSNQLYSVTGELLQIIEREREGTRAVIEDAPPSIPVPSESQKSRPVSSKHTTVGGSRLIRILLQESENAIIPERFLRTIIYSWHTPTTQMLLSRKAHLPAVNKIVSETLFSRNEELRFLLQMTIIETLDPHIEHTSLVLSLGDKHKVYDLLKKTDIRITSEVIEAVARNWRYGDEVMRLLLAREPKTNISEDFL